MRADRAGGENSGETVIVKHTFDIQRPKGDEQLVFGWANVSVRADGQQIIDYQEDIIEMCELEKAAYDFVLDFREAGEMHQKSGVGTLVESVVFTKEKAALLGIPDGAVPEGWWVGFKITDSDVWDRVKKGQYTMFSIEGKAVRESV